MASIAVGLSALSVVGLLFALLAESPSSRFPGKFGTSVGLLVAGLAVLAAMIVSEALGE